jgi:phosphatidylglycerophosphate synthase
VAKSKNEFDYSETLKTRPDETFLNFQHYILITSRTITRVLYKTPVTPHQVILFSLIIGVLSSFLIIHDNRIVAVTGAVLLFYKNVLDKVDGSLARAKGLASRRGRFYDSITDFIVSLALFTAIGFKLYFTYENCIVFVLAFLGLIFSMLQCSYFIYYEVAFIKQTGKDTKNRLLETVTKEDKLGEDKFTLLLHRIFQVIYGWQDYLVNRVDSYFLSRLAKKLQLDPTGNIKYQIANIKDTWYKDRSFLSIASLLSIGSHMVLIALFAVIGKFECYLFLNLILWNLLLIFAVFYHYYHVKRRLSELELY